MKSVFLSAFMFMTCLGIILIVLSIVAPEPPMTDYDLCTLTEKGYCANECYEDNRLIPCENFTYDEHFPTPIGIISMVICSLSGYSTC